MPDPHTAEPGNDLIGIGADLEPGTLLAAYRSGLFPMDVTLDDGTNVIGWWSPDPRGVLPVENFRRSKSLRASMRRYSVTWNQDFRAVMTACADPSRPSGWITPEFIDAYCTLHELGWAHSIEVWGADASLVGGLYGVRVGGLFAGESMFSAQRDASKVALAHLVARLADLTGPQLLDVQWATDHLRSLGAIEMPRDQYLDQLTVALRQPESRMW